MTDTRYLLDELETADLLEIDGLHAHQFELNDALLDRADAAAEADQSFESEETVVTIEALDGRERRVWQFSYNQVMEAEPAEDGSWTLEGGHRLQCSAAISDEGEDE